MSQACRIYTDGACKGNPGPGGWGVVLLYRDHRRELYGGEASTTNNRMELTAVIRALEALRKPVEAQVFSDSQYLLKGLQEWLPSWKARGWLTASREPVKNRDLWERLDQLCAPHHLDWQWVKGHAGIPENERADALANLGVQEALGAKRN
jgi:ribonuclease HI